MVCAKSLSAAAPAGNQSRFDAGRSVDGGRVRRAVQRRLWERWGITLAPIRPGARGTAPGRLQPGGRLGIFHAL